ncbi:MAG: hypothetical protein M3407_10615 [Acidobacteriota bacterium]|nr:hypothetical protein [Acidobacteriota bacterium]
MAEERNVATARAAEDVTDEDATKAELQRRMDEARESITNTVEEIKDTVSTQYQNVRETISQSLDWREQYRRRPAAFSLGALGVGLVVGYNVGGVFKGDGELTDRYYRSDGEDYGDDLAASSARSYAAGAITGGAYGSASHMPTSEADYSSRSTDSTSAARPSYSSGYQAATDSSANEPDKPGLIRRFKETQAYDRLQQEVSTLGSRAVDELSKTAQTVVLPAILGKLKDLIGIDLSTQREVAQRSKLEQQTSSASAGIAQSDAQARGQAGGSGASMGGSPSSSSSTRTM